MTLSGCSGLEESLYKSYVAMEILEGANQYKPIYESHEFALFENYGEPIKQQDPKYQGHQNKDVQAFPILKERRLIRIFVRVWSFMWIRITHEGLFYSIGDHVSKKTVCTRYTGGQLTEE